MQLHGFLSEKMSQKKYKKRVTPGWTDISGPGPISFLFRNSVYYMMLTIHNPINLLNVVITNIFSWASKFCISNYVVYKWPETAATCPNKQFQHKIHLFFLPICQDEINKVIFVWVHEFENNWHLFTNRHVLHYLLKIAD